MNSEAFVWGALLEAVQRVLTRHKGRQAAIGRSALVAAVRRELGRPVAERAVRAAINALRKEGVLICSAGGAGGGYWIAANRREALAFLEREVHPRAMDLLAVEKAMRAGILRAFGPPMLFEEGVFEEAAHG